MTIPPLPTDPAFWGCGSAFWAGFFTCLSMWMRHRQQRWMVRYGHRPPPLPILPLLVIWGGLGFGLLIGQPLTRQALRIEVVGDAVAAKKQLPKRDGCSDKSCPVSCACSGMRCDCPAETEKKKPTSLASVPPWIPQAIQVFERPGDS